MQVTDIWILIQVATVAIAYLIAVTAVRPLRPLLSRLIEAQSARPVVAKILISLRTTLKPLVFVPAALAGWRHHERDDRPKPKLSP